MHSFRFCLSAVLALWVCIGLRAATPLAGATWDKVDVVGVPTTSPGHPMPARTTPLTPAESAKSFTVPDDLEMEQVLAEPIVRQPVHLSFDERGRMWVVQYLQYPAPAGLNVVSRDKFWRAVYDKVPEPPPRGVRGLDKITIHEDTDGDGVFDKHKTFVEGLNITTACVKGRGGVWVLNPPYLLFYPDKNDDDIPDGPPVVHLEGFGLEDTHSVVNSLRWGPDGWLYAAQGSTVTAAVRVVAPDDGRSPPPHPGPLPRGEGVTPSILRPTGAPRNVDAVPSRSPSPWGEGRGEGSPHVATPGSLPVYSQGQNIWRYHPEKHIYEIFAEGGGNAFGVEFDDQGRVFSGHNGGDTRGFHYMQGAYLRKGFEKHGELSNPYAFGWLPQMDGTRGERFTHTFLIYHGGALPPRYEGKLFGVEPLQGRVVLSEIRPDGSTFKTRDLERVVTSSDSWFRPVDIKVGPDGAIYIADWYDRQVTHTRNQEGNIDTSNGRIYRLKAKPGKSLEAHLTKMLEKQGVAQPRTAAREAMQRLPMPTRDFAKKSNDALIDLLISDLEWHRQTALQVLAERHDASLVPELKNWVLTRRDQMALGTFWALYQISQFSSNDVSSSLFDDDFVTRLLDKRRNPQVRLWTVRLLGDERSVAPSVSEKLAALAVRETNIEVRAQLACTAKRLPARDGLPIIKNLLTHDEDAKDPRLPLLCWWAIESKCESDRDAALALFESSPFWSQPMVEQHLLDRVMRRFAATGSRKDLLTCGKLLQLSPSREHSVKLMAGFEEAFKGRSAAGLPDELIRAMWRHDVGSPAFKLRQGHPGAVAAALKMIADPRANHEHRRQLIEIFGDVKRVEAVPSLLRVVADSEDDGLRRAALTALVSYDDPKIGEKVISHFATFSSGVRAAAFTLLTSRPTWSLDLARNVYAGLIQPADVPRDVVRQLQRHRDPDLASLITKLWPPTSAPTTAEMEKQIGHFAEVIRSGHGDPYNGKKLFTATCASCHTLFQQGGQIGPDLTAYQRGDLGAMLLNIVNPSAEIREGYESMVVETKDGRTLTGFIVEKDTRVLVLRGLDGQNVTLDQREIQEATASGRSLMPDGLLDALTEPEVRDLFAYLRSTQPLAN